MSHKKVTSKRATFTKLEREYVKGIVYNLSFQRLTDNEIVRWLHDEKKIDVDRSTISRMRNQVERKAEKWYIQLKRTSYKYIAIYKERLDSLYSCQKKLHEIVNSAKKDEVKIRAISELHSIEMDIFSLWKQIPQLDTDNNDNNANTTVEGQEELEHLECPPLLGGGNLSEEEQEEAKEQEARERLTYFGWKNGDPPLDGHFRDRMEERYGLNIEPWDDPKLV
jgi:hypothetical protein